MLEIMDQNKSRVALILWIVFLILIIVLMGAFRSEDMSTIIVASWFIFPALFVILLILKGIYGFE
jgi:hypothetical protein